MISELQTDGGKQHKHNQPEGKFHDGDMSSNPKCSQKSKNTGTCTKTELYNVPDRMTSDVLVGRER